MTDSKDAHMLPAQCVLSHWHTCYASSVGCSNLDVTPPVGTRVSGLETLQKTDGLAYVSYILKNTPIF